VSRHAGPGPGGGPAPTPEPSYAERARTLVHLARSGMLSTLSRRHSGHPFGSVMPYAPVPRGAPLLLISSMAMHTQNLEADPRASLLVTEAGRAGDPLAGGRVTLVGRAARVPDGERAAARALYLDRHPEAEEWVDFEDFDFWRLEVSDLYFVGGFGAMGWVTAADYAAANA
jgi:heme iron utilization protein